MSLVSLTFGDDARDCFPNTVIIDPNQRRLKHAKNGVVKVRKVEQFLGTTELCVMGELVRGVAAKDMFIDFDGHTARVVETESRYGIRPVCRKGTKLILMLSQTPKECVGQGCEIELYSRQQEEREKKKGRIIIC